MENNQEAGTTSSSKIIIGVIVLLLAVWLIFSLMGGDRSNQAVTGTDTNEVTTTEQLATSEEMMDDEMADEAAMADKSEEMMDKEETMMDKETEVAVETNPIATPPLNVPAEPDGSATIIGTYTDYDEALLANAENGSVLLFFHADWCPSCRALDQSINEDMAKLPSDVTILQVDYDSETELRQKYGITRQHTLVQVDADGNEIQKLTGLTNTLDQVLAKL